ncbi:hypothetical protein [Kineosporia succinea]|uniref:Uncharacterized protein n=1 Tax=Kineosporia succinea TaxID=84632 RepID=A0ABT9NZX9_9ACTN|nr:hypothetical protein [Kineosporia succinea]MDP9825984.1 hypothetical protein [Kineosporia succinea]
MARRCGGGRPRPRISSAGNLPAGVVEATAGSTTAKKGDRISFDAVIQRADRESGTRKQFSRHELLDVQFRPAGTTTWTTVSTGYNATATGSGDHRLLHPGDKSSAQSAGPALPVTVS